MRAAVAGSVGDERLGLAVGQREGPGRGAQVVSAKRRPGFAVLEELGAVYSGKRRWGPELPRQGDWLGHGRVRGPPTEPSCAL